ncbi:MAG: carbonic anhydrase [Bacillota bacterium]
MAKCNNLVLMCMDHRFQSFTHSWLKIRGFDGQYDVISVAGSSLALINDTEHRTMILNNINLAISKHGVKRIIIFHHEDCAALGDICMETREQVKLHHEKMNQAERIIINNFPYLEIEKYFVSHKGVFYPAGFKDGCDIAKA